MYLKQQIQKLLSISTSVTKSSSNSSNNNNPVWIPYAEILSEVLPADKGTDTRYTKRIFSFLQIIPLAKAHLRAKLIFGRETLVIAAIEDLGQVLHITQNVSGMPAYKLKFFKEILLPLYRSKSEPDREDENEEKRIAVTTKQLCNYFAEQTGKTITTDNLKKTYLIELLNNGYIDEEDSCIDKRQKIYYPLIELPNADFSVERKENKPEKCRIIRI